MARYRIGTTTLFASAVLTAAGLIGGGLWLTSSDQTPNGARTATRSTDDSGAASALAAFLVPSAQRLSLETSGMAELAELPALMTTPPMAPAVEVTRVTVPYPLDLDTAHMNGVSVFATDTPIGKIPDQNKTVVRQAIRNENPNVDEYHHTTDENGLFDADSGMRGFMAHNWLNKNVGIQGGLAIPKREIRNDQLDLQDQMAVGMGVLFAF